MKYLIFVFGLLGTLISCGNSSEENTVSAPKENSSLIFGRPDYKLPQLTAPVKEQAVQWGVLEDFFMEAQNINGKNFQGLRTASERLQEYSDSLVKKIPDTLNSKPINSRLLVLKTRAALLYQVAHRATLDSADLQTAVEEMNVAVEQFIVHLNEKYKKDAIDLERRQNEQSELKKQQSFRDSVMNEELRDKNSRKL